MTLYPENEVRELEYEQYRDAKEYFRIGENPCKEHFHRAIEIQYCIRQEKKMLLDGEEMQLDEGEFLFIPPFCTHFFPWQENHETLAVVFPVSYTDMWEREVGETQLSNLIFRDKAFTNDLYVHLRLLAETKNPLVRDGIYTYVLGRLLEHGEFQPRTQKRKGDFAIRTLTYLEKHFAEPLTLTKVADALGYNYSYFSSLFKKTFRAGFCEYLAMLRVRKSLPLLHSRKAAEVAYAVGFGSIQSYYLCFKRIMGTSPAAYLQQKKKPS